MGYALTTNTVKDFLAANERKSLLRFITCGSVDDGKSTLIGRLLFDSKMIYEDQLSSLKTDSKKVGTQGDDIDFALLVDGLSAEREQGITIDVAYRFFSTDARKFIVADTPGHEQYTRNMATGASTAEAAVLLVDAQKGVITQTQRHSNIAALMGVRHVVLAVNKMDLVNYSENTFNTIKQDYLEFAQNLGFESIAAIPVSALKGDNITSNSTTMDWYQGPTLLEHLETMEVDTADNAAPFQMPVQWVNRPSMDFRGFAGTIASGSIKTGDKVRVLPAGTVTTVKEIITFDKKLESAHAGEAVTLTLTDDIDVSRGDVLSADNAPLEVADFFEADVIWMADEALIPERRYQIKTANRMLSGTVKHIDSVLEVNTSTRKGAEKLDLNDVATCQVLLNDSIAFAAYPENHVLGSFIIIDPLTNATVGAGMIKSALRNASNIHWHALDVNKKARADQKYQKPAMLWFTGLSGSGKSTVANLLEKKLYSRGIHSYLLDGDNIRHGLNKDLGFSDTDRVENIRRIGEVGKLMVDAGLMVITSFISPFRAERHLAKTLVEDGEFIEVFVDAPLDVCAQRDPKGLYKKAHNGEIKNFTGIDSPYEPPLNPDVYLDTTKLTAEKAAAKVIEYLEAQGYLPRTSKS